MLKKLFHSTAIIVALLLFAPKPAAAQCLIYCADCCPAGAHLTYASALGTVDGAEHGDCLICTEIGTCHGPCGELTVAANPARRAAYMALVRAAGRNDIASVMRLASVVPEYVHVNSKRQSIQIVSCDRAKIIASLTVKAQGTLALLADRIDLALTAAQLGRRARTAATNH